MWRNTDSSLRKKEVLNNDGCEMLLYAPNHKCIASCLQTKDGKFEIRRREEEFQAVPSLKLNARSRLTLSSLRIVILLCFAFCGADHITLRLPLYWTAFCCDMFSRDTPDPTEPWQLRRLNQYGDDINLFVLYIYAIMACEIPWLRGVLIVSAFFEFTSATLHSSSKTHGHGHGIKEDFYAYLRPSSPVLVSAICLLSEIFLLSYISPNSIQEGYVLSGAALTALAFVLRQVSLKNQHTQSLMTCVFIITDKQYDGDHHSSASTTARAFYLIKSRALRHHRHHCRP